MLASLEVEEAVPCHKNHILRGEETSTTSWAFSQQGGRAEQALSSGPGEVPGCSGWLQAATTGTWQP